jgi:hypothetical protein
MSLPAIITINTTVEDLHDTLAEGALVVRDLWFPSRREMMEWQDSSKQFYVRFKRPDRIELGLRLETPSAARLSPVWCLTVMPHEPDTLQIHTKVRFPRPTRVALWCVALSLISWAGVLMVSPGHKTENWGAVWALSVVIIAGTSLIAWVKGKKLLTESSQTMLHLLTNTDGQASDD